MELKFSEIYSKREKKKQLDFAFEIESFDFEGEEIKATKPVHVIGELGLIGSIIELTVHINTELEFLCSRCLSSFLYTVDIDAVEKFTNNKEYNEDEDIVVITDDRLDINEVIINNIISTLPIKRLCNNDCKGLCQECGTNLNLTTCSCNSGDVDIRLAKLKELFN
ncbi:uncharacterized protein SAMN02745163_02117 [Clostridium cavendishii DSM 21758]|uniref:Metal-binding protein n=1 Tax=Clostridium cavendishii DSM 21758 TaxID=1121302 RepID=A0A1M6K7G0_9CLOT|nr:DUF177 domain-containing protein [Clostridium cavendishii]SHJ54885.1 uncharacterized protein SAMN02745163_02117 [Clostridium cavendishii DSM 21758]